MRALNIVPVLRRLSRARREWDEPAVEKISDDTREDPFRVLVATMLSAQTKDAVTAAAARRLFAAARGPRAMAALRTGRVERLIYPVSFYRVKARHVRETCRQILSRFGGRVPATMEELLTLARARRSAT